MHRPVRPIAVLLAVTPRHFLLSRIHCPAVDSFQFGGISVFILSFKENCFNEGKHVNTSTSGDISGVRLYATTTTPVCTTKSKVNCTVIGWWVEVCILSRTFPSPESGQNNTTYLLSVSRQTTGFRPRSATPSIDLRPTRLFQYVSVTLSGAHLSTFVLTMAAWKVPINLARCMWN